MYGDLLGKPPGVGAPPMPPPGAALGAGLGTPPKMPGLPPPPTGAGGIPTGDPSTNKKEAADNAVLALRELKGHYPSLQGQLDTMIDGIKSAAKAPGKSNPGLGAPAPPGEAPPAETPPTDLSGSKGGF
jgi:hypothetical protein